MVHGILQFTPSIAFRYVLHRCESRDIRCRESFCVCKWHETRAGQMAPYPGRQRRARFVAIPWRLWRRDWVVGTRAEPPARGRGCLTRPGRRHPPTPEIMINRFAGRSFMGIDNDPSAGSPTETLLRLLLPLNDKVQWTSRDVAGSEPPTSPRSEHFTGPFNR